MTEQIHPGPHLDADQLAAFAEGALSERERQESLVHLSECAECRHIAFLAQGPVPLVQQPAQARVPFWRTPRLLWQGFAAAACVLVAAVSLWVWRMHTTISSPTIANTSISSAVTPPSPSAAHESSPPAPPAVADRKRALPVRPHAKVPYVIADSPAAIVAKPSAPVVAFAPEFTLPLNGRNSPALNSLASSAPQPFADNRELPPANGAIAVRIEHREPTPGGLAELAGGVQDTSGASIPNATVTLRQGNGTVARQAQTDQSGRFSIADVPSGQYDLQITAPGFLSVVRPVELQSSDLALLTSQLPVGAVSQTVNVTADAPALQTESASVAMVLPSPQGKVITASASQGKHILELDRDRVLYLSTNSGKRWKTIKPKWIGTIASIRVAESDDGFELTTEDNVVWVSRDGHHWRRR